MLGKYALLRCPEGGPIHGPTSVGLLSALAFADLFSTLMLMTR